MSIFCFVLDKKKLTLQNMILQKLLKALLYDWSFGRLEMP